MVHWHRDRDMGCLGSVRGTSCPVKGGRCDTHGWDVSCRVRESYGLCFPSDPILVEQSECADGPDRHSQTLGDTTQNHATAGFALMIPEEEKCK